MKKAYGKPTYVAARIKSKQQIIIAEVDKPGIEYAKTALKRASAKFPSLCRIIVKEI
jgi:ribosomal protein L16/L10AE